MYKPTIHEAYARTSKQPGKMNTLRMSVGLDDEGNVWGVVYIDKWEYRHMLKSMGKHKKLSNKLRTKAAIKLGKWFKKTINEKLLGDLN